MAQKKKETNKYYDLDSNVDAGISIKKIIFTIIGVGLFFGLVYGFTVLLNNRVEDRAPAAEASISYEKIMAGSSLNQREKNYVVVFYTSDDDIYEAITKYRREKDKTIYYVDLNEGLNKYVISNEAKTNVDKVSDLRVKDPTLIVVSDGKITNSKVGKESILGFLA